MEDVGEEERGALLTMLKAMLAFKPGERPTAQDIIQSEWMRNRALRELENVETS
jgi:serine/threonine-protein kinase SRPK3